MELEKIKLGLSQHNETHVYEYILYLQKIENEKDKKTKELKNPWFKFKKTEELISLFKKIHDLWLVFDGKHITLQSTGISFDYIALKNKMLNIYPESIIDVQLVYEGDEIDFAKQSWKVNYSHKISNPFSREEGAIIGAYCVIKNKRWEFLTTLNKEELQKHRKVAKTDFIWKSWFAEMCLKTVIKKAVKIHFDDIYSEIIKMDNEENSLEIPVDIKLSWKQEIDEIKTTEELKEYYLKNKGKWKDFDKYVTIRKKALSDNEKKDDNT